MNFTFIPPIFSNFHIFTLSFSLRVYQWREKYLRRLHRLRAKKLPKDFWSKSYRRPNSVGSWIEPILSDDQKHLEGQRVVRSHLNSENERHYLSKLLAFSDSKFSFLSLNCLLTKLNF